MKYLSCVLALVCLASNLFAQNVYTIKADSVKLTGCDSNELIIENHTQNVPGFLFNTGKGRTIFKRAVVKLNDSAFVIGGDTLKSNAWLQGGNRFGATGIFGTLDSNHIDFYTKNIRRGRWTAIGNLLIGTTTDNGEKFQVDGNGTINGPVVLGAKILIGDKLFNNVLGMRIYGDTLSGNTTTGSSHYAVIGLNLLETHSLYNTAKQGGGVYLDDRSTVFPLRFVVKPSSTTLSATAGGVTTTGNFVLGATVDTGVFKLQVKGTSYFSDNVVMAAGKQLSVGGINIIDNVNGRNITTISPQPFSITSGAGGTAQFNGFVKLSSATNVIFSPGSSTNNAIILSAVTTAPSNATLTFGNIRNDGLKKAVINTVDFDATSLGGSTPIDLYVYPGKEIYSGAQGNTILNYDGTNARGNVGIGVASPSAQLHTTGTVRFAGLTNDDTQTRVLVSDANGNLYYRTAASLAANDVLRSSLAVNGPVKARSLTLSQQGWPDYVFDSSYRLMPLKEVENYIQRNNHLPGIPSASEVSRDGLSVGDNQAALMKKIEELTLYNIAQQKRIDEQEKRLARLEKELRSVKKK